MLDRFFVYAEKGTIYGKDVKMQMFMGYKTARSAYNAWLRMGYSVALFQGQTWEQRTPIAADFNMGGY